MHDPFDLTTIIFALLAVFVVWKLRAVLGERNSDDPQRPEGGAEMFKSPAYGDDNIIRLPTARQSTEEDSLKEFAAPDTKLWSDLSGLKARDPQFDPAAFLLGAARAHEIIVQSFAAGDVKTLKPLLGPDVFDSFSQAIAGHQARGETLETTMVAQDKSTFETIEMQGNEARISVRFRSKMISCTKDKSGAVIEGSADQVVDIQDVWTFARMLNSRDPNWKLVAIMDI